MIEPTYPRGRRKDVIEHTGQHFLPAIEFEDGSWYREESKAMAETIRAGRLLRETRFRYTLMGYTPLVTDERSRGWRSRTAFPAVHCAHCALSIREEVSEVAGVNEVDVDLEAKSVTISGDQLDDAALRAAIVEAGYDAA